MLWKREVRIGVACVVLAGLVGLAAACMDDAANGGAMSNGGDVPSGGGESSGGEVSMAEGQVPLFEVDPLFPRPLPNHWVLGSTIGIDIDSRDHIWIIHRQGSVAGGELGATGDPPNAECCIPAPPVLEFDADGNVVNSWGGPGDGYDWPESNHGITVDNMDNVWIGGNGASDSHVLKFTRDGQFLMQIGEPDMGEDNSAEDHFWRVAEVSIDADANEVYVADGYGNRRVAVIDMQTGEMKRYWGAYGNEPMDGAPPPYDPDAPPAQQFRTPVHCAEPSLDGFVYVCDRPGDRVQVFQADGTYVQEGFVAPQTLGSGSVWDIAFSHDPEQTFIYLADGSNQNVHILNRETLEVLTEFGDGGRYPGQFFGVHSIEVDSQGNIYTTETYEGKRLQKFVFMGYGSPPAEQGVVWPSD